LTVMTLDDLIKQVQREAGSREPLDRLRAAMTVKAKVDEMTDSLIGHFVDQARRAGCSWSEIGSAMGVSKQAAQQRHTSERPSKRGGPMLARFTQRTRAALREAEAAAGALGSSYLGTEHLLLGVLAVPESIGAKALVELGLTKAPVEAAATATAAGDVDPRSGRRRRRHTPFTPRAKRVLELSMSEALKLGHNYIGTEHLVLALYDAPDGVAAKVLAQEGVEKDALLQEIVKRLAAA
jgi:hypothetical protein